MAGWDDSLFANLPAPRRPGYYMDPNDPMFGYPPSPLPSAPQPQPAQPQLDLSAPTQRTFPANPADPRYSMLARIGSALGIEGSRIAQHIYGAATLPGDIATGKTSMADPDAQRRVMDLASLTTGAPGAEAPEGALTAGAARRKPAAPAIVSSAEPTSDQINAILQSAAKTKDAPWPTATNPIFDQSLEAAQRTTDVVPQVSRRAELPAPAPGQALPEKGRMQQIIDARGQIADRISGELQPMVDRNDPMLHFYSTYPVLDQMIKQGVLSPEDAQQFMRDWAGQGAATSMRTTTPPNMRNSSFLQWRRASGNPLDLATWEQEGNTPGFRMMGEHIKRADQFAAGTENINTNPKPVLFRDAWSGNTADVVGDTHNIRSTLRTYDQLYPGQLHPSWFTSPQAYQDYRANGGFGQGPLDVGAIKDTLGDATLNKVRKQVEYGPATDPWYDAAKQLGVQPGQAQSGGWFNYGPITGLKSPPKTLPMLLNDQMEWTSKVLGVPQEKILNWWGKKKIPLAQNAAPGMTLNSTAVG